MQMQPNAFNYTTPETVSALCDLRYEAPKTNIYLLTVYSFFISKLSLIQLFLHWRSNASIYSYYKKLSSD